MATLNVSINKPRQIHLMLQAERKRVESQAKGIVSRYSLTIQRDITRDMLLGTKTGRIYYRNGRFHQASAAGESPAVDTGDLMRSVRVTLTDGGWRAHIGSPLNYARYLEDGTRYMEARPVYEPTLNRHRAAFIGEIKRMIQGA